MIQSAYCGLASSDESTCCLNFEKPLPIMPTSLPAVLLLIYHHRVDDIQRSWAPVVPVTRLQSGAPRGRRQLRHWTWNEQNGDAGDFGTERMVLGPSDGIRFLPIPKAIKMERRAFPTSAYVLATCKAFAFYSVRVEGLSDAPAAVPEPTAMSATLRPTDSHCWL